MTYHWAEEIIPGFDAAGGEVVSVTPQAAYALGERGIRYRLVEDFYDEKELRRDEEKYFLEQLEWFKKFDAFLGNELASANYNLIKYFVDSVVIQAFMLRSFLSRVGSSKIIYHRARRENRSEDLSGFVYAQNGSLFAELFPLALKGREGFTYELHETEKALTPSSKGAHKRNYRGALVSKAKNWYYSRKSRIGGKRNGNVLFLHSGSAYLDPVIRDFAKEGAAVYLVAGNGAHAVSQEIKLRSASIPGELLDAINARCGFDVAPLVLPYLQAFISKDVPNILGRSVFFERFMRERKIDRVVTHTNADFSSKAALLAAKKTGARTACIQHGCDVFQDRAWQMTDIDPFDWYLAADSVSKQKFVRATQTDYVSDCTVLESPHVLGEIARQARPRAAKKKPDVLYIPTKLLVHQRYFNCMSYPVGWYFEFQKKLMQFFESRKEFRFFYKRTGFRVTHEDESIIPFIQNRKMSISVVSGSVADWLKRADAVILDRPTTAFYEALASRLPVLALYPDFIEGLIDPEAKERFRKSLQSFRDFESAAGAISEFLRIFPADPSAYMPELPLHDDRPVRQLVGALS